MLRLFRVHTVPHRHEEKTTWLELFFDLVFVAILIELGDRLSGNLSLSGVAEFALLFLLVWSSWLSLVLYTRRFPADDVGQRILTIIYMGIMGVMAFNIHDVTETTAAGFLFAYAAAKVVMMTMYLRAWRTYPDYRDHAGPHVIVYGIASLLWLTIALVSPTVFWLWGVALGVGLLAPFYLPFIRRLVNRPDSMEPGVKSHYMMDRFGELTIIVLGEFFIKVITDASGRDVYLITLVYFAVLLSISASLWWLYFDHLDHARLGKTRARLETYMYSHFPLLAAITAYGVVGKKIVALAPGEAMSDEKRWLFCGALAVALLCTMAIEWASPERTDIMSRTSQNLVRSGVVLTLLVLGLWGRGLSATILVLLVGLILVSMVGFDIYQRLRKPEEVLVEPTPSLTVLD